MRSVDAALGYLKRGFSVIPLEPRGKKPLMPWDRYQTEPPEPDEIRRWFKDSPAANLGIITGAVSGLVVIDIDTEAAKKQLKTLLGEYDLDGVPRSRTGKGWQLFFAHPGTPIQNRAGVLPGLDVRGDGGYVVAPPSIHPNGRQYRWEVPLDGKLPKLPEPLFNLIRDAQPSEHDIRERFDTARALAGVAEGQRDMTIFKLACKLRNADVPQDIAEELILEAARNCEPPFSERIAIEKVTRAYRKFQPKQGPTKDFWPEFLTAKDILQAPADPTRWLWENCLPLGGCSILVAKPKLGKSTLAANLTLAVARGVPLLNRTTQQAGVAYVSLDASLPEMADVFTKFGLRESDPIFLHAGSAPKDCVAWIMQRVKENNVKLVVIDTLQRLFKFHDVNDYSQVVNSMDPLLDAARAENIHVCFLHHARKDSADDLDAAIGSTAVRGLAYTYIHLKRLPNSERRILRSDQRGGRNFSEVAIGFGKDGWLTVQGSKDEAEIEETMPRVVEVLKAEEQGLTEKEIRRTIPIRGWVVGTALRALLKKGQVERTGEGKPRRPFVYHAASALLDDSLSSPGLGVLGGRDLGLDKEKRSKVLETTKQVSSPGHSGQDGTRWDEMPKKASSPGHESEDFIVEWEETL